MHYIYLNPTSHLSLDSLRKSQKGILYRSRSQGKGTKKRVNLTERGGARERELEFTLLEAGNGGGSSVFLYPFTFQYF